MAIDVGYIYAAKNELQNVADASALAVARRLSRTYQSMSYADQQGYVCDKALLVRRGEVAMKNKAAGKWIDIDSGRCNRRKWADWKNLPAGTVRTENLIQPDAVQVIARPGQSGKWGGKHLFCPGARGGNGQCFRIRYSGPHRKKHRRHPASCRSPLVSPAFGSRSRNIAMTISSFLRQTIRMPALDGTLSTIHLPTIKKSETFSKKIQTIRVREVTTDETEFGFYRWRSQ